MKSTQGMLIGGLAVSIFLLVGMMIITAMVEESSNNLYALLLLLWIFIMITFAFIYMIMEGISISFRPPIRFI